MNTIRILSVVAAFAATSRAQQPASLITMERVDWASKISLEVRNVASGSSMSDSYPTWWGSYDKTWSKRRDIEVKLHNLGGATTKVRVEVIWTGKTVRTHDRIVLDRGGHEFTVDSRGHVKFVVGVNAEASDMKLATIGVRESGGAKIEGWVVTVRDVSRPSAWNPKLGTLIAVKGSEEVLVRLAQTPGGL